MPRNFIVYNILYRLDYSSLKFKKMLKLVNCQMFTILCLAD